MFGVLKGASCGLDPKLRQQWRGHTCGVCLALKTHFGQFSRLFTNYDAALLSVLYESQSPQPVETRSVTCPLRRPSRADVPHPDSRGMRYAAAVAMMMVASKVRDNLQDRETALQYFRRPAKRLADGWMRTAQDILDDLGLDPGFVERQLARQAEVEAHPGRDFLYYAAPTELAVATAFGNTAMLANQPRNTPALQAVGRMFGRMMFLLDSYQDYDEDRKAGRFNALAASSQADGWKGQAQAIFRQSQGELRREYQRLDLTRNTLAGELLFRQLSLTVARTLELCAGTGCRTRAVQARSGSTPAQDPAAINREKPDPNTGHTPGCELCKDDPDDSCFICDYWCNRSPCQSCCQNEDDCTPCACQACMECPCACQACMECSCQACCNSGACEGCSGCDCGGCDCCGCDCCCP